MKSDNKSLSNDISAAILGKLHGLNSKSAKKLVKAVDERSKDIVQKFTKLQSLQIIKLLHRPSQLPHQNQLLLKKPLQKLNLLQNQ